MDVPVSRPGSEHHEEPSPNQLLKEYLLQHEPIFAALDVLREKGWKNPAGDAYFQNQRKRADDADSKVQQILYIMMQQIADELHSQTQAMMPPVSSLSDSTRPILDLCMAPGGFSGYVLKHNPDARIRGISLPRNLGGHNLLLRWNTHKNDIQCRFLDITMLASEFGADTIPQHHPDRENFLKDRPYLGTQFGLIFCDGQVLRKHHRSSHRERFETVRLATSQLIFALQRIAPGGTLVMLLHKPDAFASAQLLYQFSQFSSIQLFKPQKKHATRSSFYMVAKNVQPSCPPAEKALGGWKEAWWQATFGGEEGTGTHIKTTTMAAQDLIQNFGGRLIELARPVWEIQREALSRASFVAEESKT